MPESLIVPIPIHKILVLKEDMTRYFSGKANQSLFMTIFSMTELENIRLMFSSFNPFVTSLLKQQTTAVSM